jgi:GxxExxY protein
MLYEELTGSILQACFEVSNELGSGFLESVYQKALTITLNEKGLHVQAQAPLSVMFRGQEVGQFFADLLVDEKIIVELKSKKYPAYP